MANVTWTVGLVEAFMGQQEYIELAVSDSILTLNRQKSWILRSAQLNKWQENAQDSVWQCLAYLFNCKTPTNTNWGNYEGNVVHEYTH